jgi:hypothetical protein
MTEVHKHMPYKPHPPEVREAVLADLRAGVRPRAIAKRHAVPARTVNIWGREAGIPPDTAARAAVENARVAVQGYAKAQRLEDLIVARERAREMLDGEELDPRQARALQSIVTSIAILQDKQRVEDGESLGPAIQVNVGFLGGLQSAKPVDGEVIEGDEFEPPGETAPPT